MHSLGVYYKHCVCTSIKWLWASPVMVFDVSIFETLWRAEVGRLPLAALSRCSAADRERQRYCHNHDFNIPYQFIWELSITLEILEKKQWKKRMNGTVYKHTILIWHINNKMLLHIESMTIKCYYKYNQRNQSIKLKGTLEGKKLKLTANKSQWL